MLKKKNKILALDPGTKHLGYAMFEDTELVDFGVKTIRQGSETIIYDHVDQLIKRWISESDPDYLILEKNQFSQIQRNDRLMLVIGKMKHLAKKNGIQLFEYAPNTIRKEITQDGNATKRQLAETMVTYFPYLQLYLKCDKKYVLRYHQNMFDAIAVGWTFVKDHISPNQAIPVWRRI